MKHLTTTLITLSLVALSLGACVPAPASPPAPIASPVAGSVAPAGEWQTYTNAEVGFSIKMPPTWSQQTLPDQNGGAIHGMAFTGAEGGVEVYWGVGFGGACPNGTEPVQLAQGELPACHATNADGTEVWSQIGYEVSGGNSFSVRAYTSNAQPSSHDLVLQVLSTLTFMPPAQPPVTITETQVITYTPGPPAGEPREGSCWTNSLAVWREDAWRCTVGNDIYDPCFSSDGSVICGASPITPTTSFTLTLTEALPAPELPQDTANHAWLVELADGTVCGFATGATGGVGDDRINYLCPSPDPSQTVVLLGDLQPGAVWMARRAVLTGSMPNLTVLESVEVPIRTVWR